MFGSLVCFFSLNCCFPSPLLRFLLSRFGRRCILILASLLCVSWFFCLFEFLFSPIRNCFSEFSTEFVGGVCFVFGCLFRCIDVDEPFFFKMSCK